MRKRANKAARFHGTETVYLEPESANASQAKMSKQRMRNYRVNSDRIIETTGKVKIRAAAEVVVAASCYYSGNRCLYWYVTWPIGYPCKTSKSQRPFSCLEHEMCKHARSFSAGRAHGHTSQGRSFVALQPTSCELAGSWIGGRAGGAGGGGTRAARCSAVRGSAALSGGTRPCSSRPSQAARGRAARGCAGSGANVGAKPCKLRLKAVQ